MSICVVCALLVQNDQYSMVVLKFSESQSWWDPEVYSRILNIFDL